MASKITPRLNRLLRYVNDDTITEVAYQSFRKYTPVRSGNAKRNTKKSGHSVLADYPYATRLEEGYSKQAPDGMTIPTIEDIRKYINKKMGSKL